MKYLRCEKEVGYFSRLSTVYGTYYLRYDLQSSTELELFKRPYDLHYWIAHSSVWGEDAARESRTVPDQ